MTGGAPAFPGGCPAPADRYDRAVLGHGSGGRLSAELTARFFVPALSRLS